MTPDEWLDRIPEGEQESTLDRLAYLVGTNGGLRVRGWGMQQYGVGPYGHVGLEQEEALELISLEGVISGFAFTLGDSADQRIAERVKERIRQQIELARSQGQSV